MRALLVLALLAAAGCGTVLPYGLAPNVLAPDLVPGGATSRVLVADSSAVEAGGRALVTGLVLNPSTGRAVPFAQFDARTRADAEGRFSRVVAPGTVTIALDDPDFVPVRADVSVGPDARLSLVVLLVPRGEG